MKIRSILFSIPVLVAAFLSLAIPGWSAEPWVSFRHIGINDGLSNTTVLSIAQDSIGYMWIGTHDGLNRYDGHSFRTYRHSSDDNTSLPDNGVRRLICDADGNLWILTHGHLSMYDRRLDRFVSFALPSEQGSEFLDFTIPDASNILLCTDTSLVNFNKETGQYTTIADGRGMNAVERIGDVCYAGSSDGIMAYDLKTSDIKKISSTVLPVNAMTSAGNSLWIATEGSGLWKYDTASKRLERFDNEGARKLKSQFVRSVLADGDGRLWIGTVGGLDVYNPMSGSLRHFTASETSGDSFDAPLSHSSVRSIYADNTGGIWIGTWYGGLNYYHPKQNRFRTISKPYLNDDVISCIVPAGDNLYIGTNAGGVNIFNTATGHSAFLDRSNGLSSQDVKAVHVDNESRKLYVGTHLGGLAVFDLDSRRLLKHLSEPGKIYAIEPAAGGDLWLGALNGLYLFDTNSNKVTKQDLSINNVTGIFRDSQGKLWFSGENGLATGRELPDRSIKEIAIPVILSDLASQYISSVYEAASDGSFWIATRQGLYHYKPSGNTVEVYTVADGLPNDVVHGVIEDEESRLWISTNQGLVVFSPEEKKFRNYTTGDSKSIRQFNDKSFAKASDGRMYFGGVGGIITFMPGEIHPDTVSSTPIINGLKLFGLPVMPGDASGIIASSLETGAEIILQPEQSMISLDFTAFNYPGNGNEAFRYRMNGLDDDWIYANRERSVTYRDMPPGNYRFDIQAANSDGEWSRTSSTEIRVLPFWYQRWWVRLLAVAFLAGIIWVLIRHFTNKRLQKQQREYEHRDYERQKELNNLKINFFVNMSHELRTPLTLILLPVTELIEQKRNEPKVVDKLKTIRSNTLRILNIINQILDYQRAENGMFPLRVQPTHVNTLLAEELAHYSEKARSSEIECRLDSTIADDCLPLDPTYLSIVIGNLLSNAFRHTPAGKSIGISTALSEDEKSLIIKVSDTGSGIDPAKLPNIFDRFYKVDETSYGSGIGLSLVKRLVTLHHGEISVESTPMEGTCFTIILPASPAAYSPEETAPANEPAPLRNTSDIIAESTMTEDSSDTAAAPAEDTAESDKNTLLIVDDNETIVRYISEALSANYNILTAFNGKEALDVINNRLPDMVITDVMMPDTDGIQLCRAIKRNIRTSHIPVIMLSAKSDVKDQLDALKVGADDYLPKPFSMPLLQAKIANWFRTRTNSIQFYAKTPEIEPAKMAMNPLDEDFLKKALLAVEKNLDNSEFTTDAFAREMLMSRSNLHIKLKALTGESANEFIRRIRMNKALELLKSGRYTVAEVSAMTGYSTPSYFSTSFRKFFGNQPSEYAKR